MKLMKKRILITGSSGFCGSFLANYFTKKSDQYTVYTTSRNNSNNPNHIIHDLSNPIPMEKFPDNLDGVIHCASVVEQNQMNFDIVEKNLRLYYNLLKFTSKLKIQHFINLSSISIYGVQNASIVDEDFKTNPDTFYGISKKFSEHLCDFMLTDQNNLVHLRLGYVLGKNFPERYFLTKFKNSILTNTPINLLNPDTTNFSFIDLRDIGQICENILPSNIRGKFNIVNDDFPSVKEVFLEILSNFPTKKITFNEKFDKSQESNTKISNTKIKDKLNFEFLPYSNSFKNIMN